MRLGDTTASRMLTLTITTSTNPSPTAIITDVLLTIPFYCRIILTHARQRSILAGGHRLEVAIAPCTYIKRVHAWLITLACLSTSTTTTPPPRRFHILETLWNASALPKSFRTRSSARRCTSRPSAMTRAFSMSTTPSHIGGSPRSVIVWRTGYTIPNPTRRVRTLILYQLKTRRCASKQ